MRSAPFKAHFWDKRGNFKGLGPDWPARAKIRGWPEAPGRFNYGRIYHASFGQSYARLWTQLLLEREAWLSLGFELFRDAE